MRDAIQVSRRKSVSSVFNALADGKEDAPSKPALASLLITIWDKDYEDERDGRFINDRVHANIQKNGTFSVIPEMPGGICSPAEPAAHRRCRGEIRRAAGQSDRRSAHRPRRGQ